MVHEESHWQLVHEEGLQELTEEGRWVFVDEECHRLLEGQMGRQWLIDAEAQLGRRMNMAATKHFKSKAIDAIIFIRLLTC